MHRISVFCTLILISAILAFSQGPGNSGGAGNSGNNGNNSGRNGDHDDNGPIQAGYAIVTPVVATTGGTAPAGLVVFGTYGLRGHGHNGGANQAGVLPPGLTTNSVMFVDSSGRLSKNLGVAIVNPNSTNTNVILTLRNNTGTQLATTTVNIPARQQTSKFVTELFSTQAAVPSEITGTLAITSAASGGLPVSVVGLRFRGSNFSTLPVTNLAPSAAPIPANGSAGGPGAVLLPQFAAGGGWATEIVMVNTGTSSMTVRLDLFKADGTALTAALNGQSASSFTNLVIPAGGVLVMAPRDRNGDDDF